MSVDSFSVHSCLSHLPIAAPHAPHILAVSDTTRYIVIPLLAAVIAASIAALGIALPLALVARNERIKIGLQRNADHEKYREEQEAERAERIAQSVMATKRDALLLRELITALSVLKEIEAGSLSDQAMATIHDARERLFTGLHENPELFATLVPDELQKGRRLEKLMLLLGLLECRVREFEQTQQLDSGLTLFGLGFLVRAVDPTSIHTDTYDALQVIAKRDKEAAVFLTELLDEGQADG